MRQINALMRVRAASAIASALGRSLHEPNPHHLAYVALTAAAGVPDVPTPGARRIAFLYTNWRGEDYQYVIEPTGLSFDSYADVSAEFDSVNQAWMLHGDVVTRDGDPRPDMGRTRRRSFILQNMRGIIELAPNGQPDVTP